MVYIVAVLLFFCLITFPFKMQSKIYFNFKQNFGVVSLYVLNKRMFLANLIFQGKTLFIKTKKRKLEKDIQVDKQTALWIKNFYSILYSTVAIRHVNIYTKIGTSNPFYSSVLGGLINIIFTEALLSVKNKNSHGEFVYYNHVTFFDNNFAFACRIRIFVSCLDILNSYIKAKIKTKKEIANGRRKKSV